MVDIYACDQLIEIGRQQENEYRRVRFPMADVLGQYPDATFNVLNRRSADMSAYVVPASQISVEGTDVCWVLKASDLAYIGDGECEVIAYSGNTVAKDEIYTVRVLAALDEGMDPPDPSWDEYLADLSAIADRAETAETGSAENALKAEGYAVGRQNGEPADPESPYYHGNAAYFAGEAGVSAATAAGSAGEAAGSASAAGRSAGSAAGSAAAAETAQIKAEEAQAAAESARDQITGMTAEAATLDPGESATASYSDGVLSLGIPRGADGQDGTDGYSPSAAVSKSGSTATITITDKTGTTTAEISDGQDGADGYTPVRGTDYWTTEDQAAIIADTVDAMEPTVSELKSKIDGTSITHLIDFPTTELSASAANKTVYFKGNRIRQVISGATSTSYRYFTLCKGRILVNSSGAESDLGSLTADDFMTLPETEGLYDIRLDLSIRNRNSANGNNPILYLAKYTDSTMTTLEIVQLNPTAGATAVQDRTEIFEQMDIPGRKFVIVVTIRNNNNEFVAYLNAIPSRQNHDANVVTVTGSTPSITGKSGKRYICGTVDSISITPPSTGIIDVVFSSGTTPTVLTASGVTWPSWFDSTSLNASTVYDITIKDGYGVVNTWT